MVERFTITVRKSYILVRLSRPRSGVVVIAPMWPEFDFTCGHEWFKLVVGSSVYSERFFSRFSGFPLPSKINISKFQFDWMLDLPKTTSK